MNIVFSSDDNYAPFLGVAIYSLLKNNHFIKTVHTMDKIVIYVMDREISDKNKKDINAIAIQFDCEIIYLETSIIHDRLQKTIKLDVRSLTTYYRLFLPTLLPEFVTKVIYMDCDCLINAPLDELWNTNIDDYEIAGVLDLVATDCKIRVGLAENEPYLNAGMLVINLAKWREENIEQQMIDFILKHQGRVCYHDQGTINGVCLKKKILHPRYNAMTPIFVMSHSQLLHYHSLKEYYSKEELLEAKNTPSFIHFTPYLVDRPWVKANLHPLKKLYKSIQDQTPWEKTVVETPSKTLEPWVKWMFRVLPYWTFIRTLGILRSFRLRTWFRQLLGSN